MKRPFLTASLAAGLCLCAHAGPMAPTTLFADARHGVLTLHTLAQDGTPIGSASAVAIAAGRFVTLCGPLDGSDSVRLANADGTIVSATIAARDSERNLCLLSAPDARARALTLAPANPAPRVGARVFAVSNALGFGVGLTEGVISGVGRGDRGELLQFSAPVSPGSEGGALVDDEGRLLGIIDYRQREGQNVNLAAPAAWIAQIEPRNDADGARQALRDRAPRLARAGDGAELGRLADDWTRLHPDDADGWLWRALASDQQGDFTASEQAWRRAAELAPDMPLVALGLADVLLRQQRFDEARAAAETHIAANPEYAPAWVMLGQAQHGLGAAAAAESAYRKAISLDPWQTRAHQGLIGLASQRGDPAAAIEGWSNLVRLDPSQPQLRWGLVEALLLAQQGARAHAVLARLPAELAESADGLFWRGATAALLGRPQAATELFHASLALGPSEPARAWTALGKAYYVLERFPDAIAALREAVRIAPDDADHRYWLAVALKSGGHVGEAVEIDRELVAEHPDDANVWRQLGYALVTAGTTPEGTAALERSLALDPVQPRVWNALMMLYRHAGRDADVVRAHTHLRGLDATMAERAYLATIRPHEARPR
nr:tetratricopeptide repeat protein [Zoogloeaceae bacterium]